MKKVAVILSGSGVFDGTEVNEAVLTFLALEQNQIHYETFAPNAPQAHVINHLTGDVMEESRNVLIESNRITRSTTKDIAVLEHDDFDALLFIGGFGAAKNLSDFAFTEKNYTIDRAVLSLIKAFHENSKFVVGLCITPLLLAAAIPELKLTLGNDADIASMLNSKGHHHIECPTQECVLDETNKVITTPAYMTGASVLEVHHGVQATIKLLSEKL
ncbi:isoprenoid biosynthesis glyoxalase ElbB [Vibrio astriarenae]